MRAHVCEVRDGQIEIRGGSSETELNELTTSPRGSPAGAAVTKATPVANLDNASRNESPRRTGDGLGEAAVVMGSVEVGVLAEGHCGEIVVSAVGAKRVHERAGFDVAIGAGE